MKKKLALFLSISILTCNFNSLFCKVEGNVGKIAGASIVLGSVAAVLANKSKAPKSLVCASGYYGVLLSFVAISFMSFGPYEGNDAKPFVLLPAMILGVIGVVPIGFWAMFDLGKKAASGK